MTAADRERWDQKHRAENRRSPGAPTGWLEDRIRALPRPGRALDLACGTGADSLLLASRGLRVTAVDISQVALDIGKRVAGPLPIEWVCADLDDYEPEAAAYDVVICFRFLDRARLPQLVRRGLKPGGYFLGETFNSSGGDDITGRPTNVDYLLLPNEWLEMFGDWEVVEHQEGAGLSGICVRRPRT